MLSIALFCSLLPFYDIDKSFTDNTKSEKDINFYQLFDYPLRSPLGIPACAIMTSKGIEVMAKLGFSVFTYKTIRSCAYAGHPIPNICFVNCCKQLEKNDIGQSIRHTERIGSIDELALANSFGNNALSLEESCADIAKARAALSEGQVLIVSIFGSDSEQRSCAQDFAYVAAVAVKAGAQIIEANLSCPNILCNEPLYKNPAAVFEICSAITEKISPIPLIIKVGIFDSEQMTETLKAAANAGARGVCGINSVSMHIESNDGLPYFGDARELAGVSGNPIRSLALEFVKNAKKIIDQEQLNLMILATGGITKREHFDEFLNAGATIAMSAAGAMYNPSLAIEYIRMKLGAR